MPRCCDAIAVSLSLALGVLAMLPGRAAHAAPGEAAQRPAPGATASPQMTRDDARHLLARTGFLPDAATLEAFTGLTREQGVQRILAGVRREALTEPPAWTDEPPLTPHSLRGLDEKARRDRRRLENERAQGLKVWWIEEMRVTDSPLTERMTLFWHDHFTSSLQKVRSTHLMYRQNALLRQHAVGNYGTLLHAVARDPAMMVYLDNTRNLREAPNENFARELLELFTLGEGQYTERDIKEAARAFTGWGVDRRTLQFEKQRRRHDGGVKEVLGQRGRFDGDDIVDILLQQPRAAATICEKLWREFISLEPAPLEVERFAGLLRETDYALTPLLRAIFLSDSFWAPAHRAALIKSPAELVVGTMRLAGVRADAADGAGMMRGGEAAGRDQEEPALGMRAMRAMRAMGQDLLDPPNVAGWEGGKAWITAGTLLMREQFVESVAEHAGRRASVFASLPSGPAARRHLSSWLLATAPLAAPESAPDARAFALALLTDPAYQLK